MSTVALVTAAAARHLDEDLPPLLDAFERAGAPADVVVWDDPDVDWSSYSLAVVRSTWDYVPRRAEFLAWATMVEHFTDLANPADLLAWSTDKGYLADLAGHGIEVSPTTFVRPGASLEAALALVAIGDVVVKPSISAGSADTARHAMGQADAVLCHVESLTSAGRTVMVQPYLEAIDTVGETALVYFDAVFSHAIRTAPILAGGRPGAPAAAFVEGLFAAEQISPRPASPAELDLGARVLAAVPGGVTPLYARVDVVPDADGRPVVLELELAEPSVFLTHAPGSADRFVAAIGRRARRSPDRR